MLVQVLEERKNKNCRCLFYFLAAEVLISSCSSSLSSWACLFTRSEAASSYGMDGQKDKTIQSTTIVIAHYTFTFCQSNPLDA